MIASFHFRVRDPEGNWGQPLAVTWDSDNDPPDNPVTIVVNQPINADSSVLTFRGNVRTVIRVDSIEVHKP